MKSRSGLARSKQTRNRGLGGLSLNANAAHHVMAGWSNFHRPLGDVHVGQFTKLVIHAWQFFLNIIRRLVRDVEVGATVFCAAAFLRFGVDRARHHVARGQLHLLGVVALHKSLAIFVAQHTAFAAHGFSHQNALYAGRPDHAGGMKLHKLHVHQLGARIVGQPHPVAGVFPGV